MAPPIPTLTMPTLTRRARQAQQQSLEPTEPWIPPSVGENLGLMPQTIEAIHAVRASLAAGATPALDSAREGAWKHLVKWRDREAEARLGEADPPWGLRYLYSLYELAAQHPDLLRVQLGSAEQRAAEAHSPPEISPYTRTWMGAACETTVHTTRLDLLWLPVAAGVISPTQKMRVYWRQAPATFLEFLERLVATPTSTLGPEHVEAMLGALHIRESAVSSTLRRLSVGEVLDRTALDSLRLARARDAANGIDINADHQQFGLLPPLMRLAYFPKSSPVTGDILEWLIREGADPFASANVHKKEQSPLIMLLDSVLHGPETLLRFVRLVPHAFARTPGTAQYVEDAIQYAKGSTNPVWGQVFGHLREDIKAATMMGAARKADDGSTPAATSPRRRRPGVF